MTERGDARKFVKRVVPESVYRPVLTLWRRLTRTRVRGDLLIRSRPVSDTWGLDRGTPIDRWYTEQFLAKHADAIGGHTLEMADSRYTRSFGGGRVTKSDVLHWIEGNPEATMVGDLVTGEGIPKKTFDCMIVVNTFPIIFEVQKAIETCYAALKTGGVLLANFHGIFARVPDGPAWDGDFWRFTSVSVSRLCAPLFGKGHVLVEPAGNVRSAAAFLYGLAAEEVGEDALNLRDERYEVVVNLRATRA